MTFSLLPVKKLKRIVGIFIFLNFLSFFVINVYGQDCPDKNDVSYGFISNLKQGKQGFYFVFKNGTGSDSKEFYLRNASEEVVKRNYTEFKVDPEDFEYIKNKQNYDTLFIYNISENKDYFLGIVNQTCNNQRGVELSLNDILLNENK